MTDFQQTHELDRILVIRLSSLGDILLTAPALRVLRSRFPTAQIDFLTSRPYVDLAAGLPGVDHVLDFDKEKGLKEFLCWQSRLFRARYSLIIDLQNSQRSALWRVFSFPAIWVKAKRYRLRRFILIRFRKNFYRNILPVSQRYLTALESLGCVDDGGGLELYIPESITHQVRLQLEKLEIIAERAVILAPGARHATKRWPPEKWIDLARKLLERDFKVLIIGDREDQSLIKTIVNKISDDRIFSFTEQPLLKTAAIMKSGVSLVSNDSGLMHLAAAVGTPVIALFGPTVEEFGFFPFRAKSQVVQKDLPCRPCSAMGTERCPKDHFRCMNEISVEEVLEITLRLLGRPEIFPVTTSE